MPVTASSLGGRSKTALYKRGQLPNAFPGSFPCKASQQYFGRYLIESASSAHSNQSTQDTTNLRIGTSSIEWRGFKKPEHNGKTSQHLDRGPELTLPPPPPPSAPRQDVDSRLPPRLPPPSCGSPDSNAAAAADLDTQDAARQQQEAPRLVPGLCAGGPRLRAAPAELYRSPRRPDGEGVAPALGQQQRADPLPPGLRGAPGTAGGRWVGGGGGGRSSAARGGLGRVPARGRGARGAPAAAVELPVGHVELRRHRLPVLLLPHGRDVLQGHERRRPRGMLSVRRHLRRLGQQLRQRGHGLSVGPGWRMLHCRLRMPGCRMYVPLP